MPQPFDEVSSRQFSHSDAGTLLDMQDSPQTAAQAPRHLQSVKAS